MFDDYRGVIVIMVVVVSFVVESSVRFFFG